MTKNNSGRLFAHWRVLAHVQRQSGHQMNQKTSVKQVNLWFSGLPRQGFEKHYHHAFCREKVAIKVRIFQTPESDVFWHPNILNHSVGFQKFDPSSVVQGMESTWYPKEIRFPQSDPIKSNKNPMTIYWKPMGFNGILLGSITFPQSDPIMSNENPMTI